MIHILKSWPHYFDEIEDGRKTFEIRDASDRTFQAGDEIELHRFDPKVPPSFLYVGSIIRLKILAVYSGLPGINPGYVGLSVERIEKAEAIMQPGGIRMVHAP